ncbi:MAG: hypothetical protein HQL54_00825 [Magnetococcales bacterium]|nr:hypothetical protein [Magnetococcales bacterium]
MENDLIERFRRVVETHTGLVIPSHDTGLLEKTLATRSRTCKCKTFDHYLTLLDSDTLQANEEWRQLVLVLTTGESYFFRDSGQISLLRDVLLPDLIQQRQNSKQLRIWSAGCSTGEEPYSLAMILRDILPDWDAWQVFILGSDINEQALSFAKKATYNEWSFRRVEPYFIDTFFEKKGQYYQLNDAIRQTVEFRYLNLIKELFPASGSNLYDFDLIICRNVFIYFDAETINGLVKKFGESLTQGGYFLTGHAEVSNKSQFGLQARLYPESLVYHKPKPPVIKSPKSITTSHTSSLTIRATTRSERQARKDRPTRIDRSKTTETNSRNRFKKRPDTLSSAQSHRHSAFSRRRSNVSESKPDLDQLLAEAAQALQNGAYPKSIELVESIQNALIKDSTLAKGDLTFQAHLILARALANLGRLDDADQACQKAIKENGFSAEPHFLLAQLAQEQGQPEHAKKALKKTIYLSHDHVSAYLELAGIYAHESKNKHARKMRETALELLLKMPKDAKITGYEAWPVSVLCDQLKEQLER